ncbi:hypothetical protein SLEP1_g23894 [Rubroshorea leprosula]|uniref:Uncharacterized protein n=1 Tax=Rubroshorea leprosula TaxID=152421 RepID=A0AAV5JDV1_9ROSI|nr:hypothetical protein SLEP1_g23894 [Rubroshorea leprosula]
MQPETMLINVEAFFQIVPCLTCSLERVNFCDTRRSITAKPAFLPAYKVPVMYGLLYKTRVVQFCIFIGLPTLKSDLICCKLKI